MSGPHSGRRHDLLIGGERVRPASDKYLDTIDPATGDAFASVAVADDTDVDRAVRTARDAFPAWRDTDPAVRGRTLTRIAESIRGRADDLAAVESRDQGKPVSQARSDIVSAARYF